MDLSRAKEQTAQDNTGVLVPLLDRLGEPDLDSQGKQSTVTVLGEYADPIRKTEESQARRYWKGGGSVDPATTAQANRIERAATAIVAWSGFEDQGKPLPFTRENAVAMLTAAPWILKQVEVAIDQPSRFFGTR